jgi:plasmid stability protein
MRPELDLERKIWLIKHPGVILDISQRAGVSPSFIYRVLHGRARSARVAAALAAAGAPGFPNERRQRMQEGKVLQVRLPEDLHAWLTERAHRDGVALTALVRAILSAARSRSEKIAAARKAAAGGR